MERRLTMSLARRSSSWTSPSSCRATRRWQFLGAVARRRSAESASVGVPRSQSESRMWEIHMSGLMSGEGKRAGCSRTRNRALPRLYANCTVCPDESGADARPAYSPDTRIRRPSRDSALAETNEFRYDGGPNPAQRWDGLLSRWKNLAKNQRGVLNRVFQPESASVQSLPPQRKSGKALGLPLRRCHAELPSEVDRSTALAAPAFLSEARGHAAQTPRRD